MTKNPRGGYVLPLMAILLLSGCHYAWTESNIDATEKKGDLVIAALESYYSTHNEYPRTLKKLVPKYLSEIPSPAIGGLDWKYETYWKGQSFILKVEGSNQRGRVLSYNSRHKGWPYDDGSF